METPDPHLFSTQRTMITLYSPPFLSLLIEGGTDTCEVPMVLIGGTYRAA